MSSPSERVSGLHLVGAESAGIMLAIPNAYDKPLLAESVRTRLAAGGFSATLSTRVSDYAARASLIVSLDGWADLALLDALLAFRMLLPAASTLAIATQAQGSVSPLLDAGFDDCVLWPAGEAELLSRVRTRLRRAAPPLVRASLDPALLELRCAGVEVKLTPAEFKLVRRLFEAAGDWVGSKQLLESLSTGRRFGGTPVARHVHAIRRKLEIEAWRLESHRRLGYRLHLGQQASRETAACATRDLRVSEK